MIDIDDWHVIDAVDTGKVHGCRNVRS